MKLSKQGGCFLLCLVLTAWVGLLTVLVPPFVLAVVGHCVGKWDASAVYRWIARWIQWAWMGNVCFLLERVYGIEIIIHGCKELKGKEELLRGERALMICNHRTRIDWMLLWSVSLRLCTLQNLKIILKSTIRKIPVFGWAVQHFLFISLNRNWSEDQEHLKQFLPYLSQREPEASYLLFPEGTDLSESNLKKNAAYAEKNGLPPRKYSLYPRTTGWTFMLPLMRKNLDAVYDVTMFFIDHKPGDRPSEASLLTGCMPRAIHFYVERFPINDFPESNDKLVAWMQTRFEKKEELLRDFYENNRLPENAAQMFVDSQTPVFALLAGFWVFVITIGISWGWALGWIGVLYGASVFVGHLAITFVKGGIDGYMVNNM